MKFQPSAFRAQVTRLIRPMLHVFVQMRVNANVVTTLGFLVTVSAGVAFFFGQIQLGGLLVLLGGFLDVVDGHIARETGTASTFGSFYDSTLDRASEVVVFLGVFSLYNGAGRDIGQPWMVYVVALAMAGSLMVSYTRAKAESMGIDCKVGLMQRAERILLLGGATLFFGSWRHGLVLTWVMFAMALLTNLTAFYRIVWVYRHLRPASAPAAKRSFGRVSTPVER